VEGSWKCPGSQTILTWSWSALLVGSDSPIFNQNENHFKLID
jgi:hypothetical protein